jgi:hypothetical protein
VCLVLSTTFPPPIGWKNAMLRMRRRSITIFDYVLPSIYLIAPLLSVFHVWRFNKIFAQICPKIPSRLYPFFMSQENHILLDICRRSWFNIDYLRSSLLEEHCLGVVELPIIDFYFMILVTNDFKAKLSI